MPSREEHEFQSEDAQCVGKEWDENSPYRKELCSVLNLKGSLLFHQETLGASWKKKS